MNSAAPKTRRRWLTLLLAGVLVGELGGVAYVWPAMTARWHAGPERLHPQPPARPATWAQPLAAAGLKNFHKVSPNLYRGARPTPEGIAQLKALGVKTVVNLEVFHRDENMLAGTGMGLVNISFKALHPEREDMVRFLKVVTDPNLTPVFVHCMHGSDRTGTMCAVYRIAVQGWSKPEAIDEMLQGGFGFHTDLQNLPAFLDRLDVEKLKRESR